MRPHPHPDSIKLFTVTPRERSDVGSFLRDLDNNIRWSERYGFSGILLFTGNDTFIDPWLAGQRVLSLSRSLSPLIAVNPIYMHPFTAAKMVASLSALHGRKIHLNMVAGAALSHLRALGDDTPHERRYQRLEEYIHTMDAALHRNGRGRYEGEFYRLSGLQLRTPLADDLLPEYYLAGQSAEAARVAERTGSCPMQMLPAPGEHPAEHVRGINLGIVARPTADAALDAARRHFPLPAHGRRLLDASMNNTDSEWKRRLRLVGEHLDPSRPDYWLEPFLHGQADCPILVASVEDAAESLLRLVRGGIHTFIVDVAPEEEEYANVQRVFARVRQQLAEDRPRVPA